MAAVSHAQSLRSLLPHASGPDKLPAASLLDHVHQQLAVAVAGLPAAQGVRVGVRYQADDAAWWMQHP
jgi:hypothetical protein